MNKKSWKSIATITIVAVLVLSIIIGLFWLGGSKSKEISDKNSLGKELKKIIEEPKIKKTWLSHEKKAKLEKIKPDEEKTELTVRYQGSFFVENSQKTFAIFWPANAENAVEIAVASESPILQGKGLKFDAKLKFKMSFFSRDVQKNWAAGRKVRGKYWYFNKDNDNFQLEPINYQWENSQSINPSFLGKWKIDLKKSIESGFAKINSEIRQRMDEQLPRDCYTNAVKYNKSLEIEIKEENSLIQILGGSRYTIFWIKNLDDYTTVCFTDYHPNHHFDILEDDALSTLFKLDQSKKTLTVYNPWIVQDVCTNVGLDHEKMLGWVPWTTNREYNRLNPYFQENAHIIATKID